jgi:serine/threonine protein kinase/AmiR/NasT family two-component response regulator
MPRLIIAENHNNDRKLYAELIAPLCYEYVICTDGEAAIEEFRKAPADLVILDYDIPKLNGFEVCKLIRQDPEGLTVPLMIVSARNEEKIIVEALNAGATDYLLKPFGHTHFIAKVKSYINFYSLHQKDSWLVKNKSIFAGRYKVEKLIGCGSHSSIFFAIDQTGEYGEVAIKLLMESASEENFASSFIKMANKFKALDCENIVKIFDSGQYGGRLFLIMEYAKDGDLATILKRKTLSDYDTAELISDIASGIKVLQENNMVHFDIKPENIILNGHTFLLADFGIIPPKKKRTVSLRHTDIWTTIAYVAPEYLDPDFHEEANHDVACDIYSLGITAYEAFTGINPFEASKVAVSISKQVNLIPPPLSDYADIDPSFLEIIGRMLSKKPEDRPSVDEVIATFNQILEVLKDEPPVFGKHRQEIHHRALANLSQEGEVHSEIHVNTGDHRVDAFESVKKGIFADSSPGKGDFSGQEFFKRIRFVLLAAASVILLLLFTYGVYRLTVSEKFIETRGTMRVTICSDCKFKEQKSVVDVSKAKCGKCGKQKLAYVMFCKECSTEFPFKKALLSKKNMTKEEMLKQLSRLNRCPKCRSENTQVAMTDTELIKNLAEFKKKKKE